MKKIVSKVVSIFSKSPGNRQSVDSDFSAVKPSLRVRVDDNLFVCPSVESEVRASKVLSMQGREDVSTLLVRPILEQCNDCLQDETEIDKEYLVKIADVLNPVGVRITLNAPANAPFDGKEVWDVMMSLGLRWGNMDLFHWENNNKTIGDNSLFVVWTSTSPGYFYPEEIALGNFSPQDLHFSFEIARSPDPIHVFENMIKAAEYAKQRLGGDLTINDEDSFNTDKIKRLIENIVQEMKSRNLTPGQGLVMELWKHGAYAYGTEN